MTGIVVIGASNGGVHALRTLIHGLPEEFDAPIVIVLHGRARRNVDRRSGSPA
jgi:chemotaxis response regulator CheB